MLIPFSHTKCHRFSDKRTDKLEFIQISRKKLNLLFILIPILLMFFSGCNSTRRIPNGSYLLNTNKYVLLDKQNVNMSDIAYISTHIPNKRILDLFRFNLHVYTFFDSKKQRKIPVWFQKHFGEAPVILDTNLVNSGIKQIKLYLYNYGYFNAEVSKEIIYKHKKANVIYKIKANEPYTINNITQNIQDSSIKALINKDTSLILLKKGNQYQSKIISQERDRITELLNRRGFYRFSKEFITFSIDTNLSCNCLNINTIIQDPFFKKSGTSDSIIYGKHIPYKIRNVVVNTNFNPLLPTESYSDTLLYQKENQKFGSYIFIYNSDLKYSPKKIASFLTIAPGDLYNLGSVNRTYTRLNELKNFSFINIIFTDISDSLSADSIRYLDCKIQLRPTDKFSFSAEAKGTNTGGNLGIGVDFTTITRNVFKGNENLMYRLGAAYEAQKLFSNNSTTNDLLLFNTFEFSGSVKLDIPRFYFPIKIKYFTTTVRPKSIFNIGGNYQQRPDYTRFISTSYFGYEWIQKRIMKHSFNPIDINIVKINPTASFLETLNRYNRRIREQYTDHLLVAMRYNFTYDNQSLKKGKNFIYFRFGIESVGNVLNLAMNAVSAKKNESDQYTIGGIPYANYLLSDFDFRYYHQYTKKTSFAFRTSFGIGVPFTNSFSLPFEKSFYLGGANSMRGWKMRTLGPGSFDGGESFESIGDLKIESNVEYRFPIWNYFRGAFFMDAGNIWLVRANTSIPNGEFKFNQFYKEFGVDAGFGLRLDFDYFLIRVDAAIPLANPVYLNNPDLKTPITLSKTVLNFGIGYPF